MDIADATMFFAKSEVADAYTGDLLFYGQLAPYDQSVRDSVTGWRRSVSADVVVEPSRGVVSVGGSSQIFISGRVIPDMFQGDTIRQHLLLHPADGLLSYGFAKDFISGAALTDAYAALSWLKAAKEEEVSSETFNIVNFYVSSAESLSRDAVILFNSLYYRVRSIEPATGGMQILVCYEMGTAVLTTVSYTALAGTYDLANDMPDTVAPISITAFCERYQSNYRYLGQAAVKFLPGDLVITVSVADVPTPIEGSALTVAADNFILLAFQSDGQDAWELHVRPN